LLFAVVFAEKLRVLKSTPQNNSGFGAGWSCKSSGLDTVWRFEPGNDRRTGINQKNPPKSKKGKESGV